MVLTRAGHQWEDVAEPGVARIHPRNAALPCAALAYFRFSAHDPDP